MPELFSGHRRLVERADTFRIAGRVVEVTGLTVVAEGLPIPVGSLCRIERSSAGAIPAQVVGVRGEQAILLTLQEPLGVGAGDPVISAAGMQCVSVGRQMLGCVLDGLGRPIDGPTDFAVEAHYPVYSQAPPALTRRPIRRALATGIRAVDAMHTFGGGQRMGVFAGTGVGKSILMGMVARYTDADVIVAALIGERGREVGNFLRNDLGEARLRRTVLVISTSDESPVLRVRAAFVATAVAEYFRDLGRDVLLLADSITRMAMAQRQIGLSAGEPPTTKGYPPSVFSLLPALLERSGKTDRGSITGLYTVLVEGDDIGEPVSDAIRGTLDGHIWLSRDLANRGHYPAVSVPESISRVMDDVVDDEHMAAASEIRKALAVWNDIEDLVNLGAYTAGSNVEFDVAVKMKPVIDEFLRQAIEEQAVMRETRERLLNLATEMRTLRGRLVSEAATNAVKKKAS